MPGPTFLPVGTPLAAFFPGVENGRQYSGDIVKRQGGLQITWNFKDKEAGFFYKRIISDLPQVAANTALHLVKLIG